MNKNIIYFCSLLLTGATIFSCNNKVMIEDVNGGEKMKTSIPKNVSVEQKGRFTIMSRKSDDFDQSKEQFTVSRKFDDVDNYFEMLITEGPPKHEQDKKSRFSISVVPKKSAPQDVPQKRDESIGDLIIFDEELKVDETEKSEQNLGPQDVLQKKDESIGDLISFDEEPEVDETEKSKQELDTQDVLQKKDESIKNLICFNE